MAAFFEWFAVGYYLDSSSLHNLESLTAGVSVEIAFDVRLYLLVGDFSEGAQHGFDDNPRPVAGNSHACLAARALFRAVEDESVGKGLKARPLPVGEGPGLASAANAGASSSASGDRAGRLFGAEPLADLADFDRCLDLEIGGELAAKAFSPGLMRARRRMTAADRFVLSLLGASGAIGGSSIAARQLLSYSSQGAGEGMRKRTLSPLRIPAMTTRRRALGRPYRSNLRNCAETLQSLDLIS